ncbi:MAG: hypothetical protein IPK72_03415 [Candidatus Eisenbacteria bacterium]|nr:hypothetical protein [Candidatus Eisenbacteria bacterium]
MPRNWTMRALAVAPFSLMFVLAATSAFARSGAPLLYSAGAADELPARTPGAGVRADTLCFGYVQTVGGALYAVPGETWTFDHGGGGLEGWYAVDLSADPEAYGRRIDAASWAGHGNAVAAPLISGVGVPGSGSTRTRRMTSAGRPVSATATTGASAG